VNYYVSLFPCFNDCIVLRITKFNHIIAGRMQVASGAQMVSHSGVPSPQDARGATAGHPRQTTNISQRSRHGRNSSTSSSRSQQNVEEIQLGDDDEEDTVMVSVNEATFPAASQPTPAVSGGQRRGSMDRAGGAGTGGMQDMEMGVGHSGMHRVSDFVFGGSQLGMGPAGNVSHSYSAGNLGDPYGDGAGVRTGTFSAAPSQAMGGGGQGPE
jgi:hypothetical protein